MNNSEYPARHPVADRAREENIAPGHFYVVGGGIASLAAAAFLIRDADVPGCLITIFEALDKPGGSLDGAGSPQEGYVVRGGRMLESK
jgi:oleate hydratase